MSDLGGVLVAVLLLALNAFFVGAEFALISARRSQIEPRAQQGSRVARTTLRAMENVSLMMAGAQLVITICSLGLGAVGEPAVLLLGERVERLHDGDAERQRHRQGGEPRQPVVGVDDVVRVGRRESGALELGAERVGEVRQLVLAHGTAAGRERVERDAGRERLRVRSACRAREDVEVVVPELAQLGPAHREGAVAQARRPDGQRAQGCLNRAAVNVCGLRGHP